MIEKGYALTHHLMLFAVHEQTHGCVRDTYEHASDMPRHGYCVCFRCLCGVGTFTKGFFLMLDSARLYFNAIRCRRMTNAFVMVKCLTGSLRAI